MVMLWRFTNPHDARYAGAARRGSWRGLERVRPLVIEWERGSDLVGDFTWPGFDSDIVVTGAVGDALTLAGFPGFELAPVEMVEDAKLAHRKRERNRVRLPYVGPQLWDLWVTARYGLDQDRSTVDWVERADGTRDLKIRGIQHEERKYDRKTGQMVSVMMQRKTREGLFVRGARGVFRIDECPAWIFCCDEVKQLVEKRDFTNVAFLEMGDILSE